MVTVVNNPAPSDNSGGPMGMIVALIVLIVLGFLFFMYALPALRQSRSGTQINVPSEIDVNINKSE